MAYTPTEWKDGDTITAAKLNNAENGIMKASIVDVTPAPTYYSVTSETEISGVLPDFPLDVVIEDDSITVIVDGVSYVAPKTLYGGISRYYYGALQGENYPFVLVYDVERQEWSLYTLVSGVTAHSVTIIGQPAVTPSDIFKQAVAKSGAGGCVTFIAEFDDSSYNYTIPATA